MSKAAKKQVEKLQAKLKQAKTEWECHQIKVLIEWWKEQ